MSMCLRVGMGMGVGVAVSGCCLNARGMKVLLVLGESSQRRGGL